jgi:hypothetical protein
MRETWIDAQDFCRSLDMELASIHNDEENNHLKSKRGGKDFWIGYNDQAGEQEYHWTDLTCSTYDNWAPGEPNNLGNEDCTH